MTATIGGKITGEKGDPIAGIPVYLVHEPTGSKYAESSNDAGMYQFSAIRVGGPYMLIIAPPDAELIEQGQVR